VLWVVTLLMVVAGQFGFAVRHELRSLRQFKESTEADYIAEAGLSRGVYELLKDRRPGEDIDVDDLGEEVPDWRINTAIPPVTFSNGSYRVRIDNASGRINLNTAGEALLRLMLNRTELSDIDKTGIVDAILDWRDADDLHRLNGAESDYYQSLPRPYNCKNGDFDTTDELLFVKGITPEIYHGVIQELVTVINDPVTQISSVRTALRRRGNSDDQRININAAPPAVLLTLPEMNEDLMDAIVSFRAESDFRNLADISETIGAEVMGAISPFISFELSPYYIIRSEGMVNMSPVKRRRTVMVRIDPTLPERFVVLQHLDG
jgi:general secretion pathway protein K